MHKPIERSRVETRNVRRHRRDEGSRAEAVVLRAGGRVNHGKTLLQTQASSTKSGCQGLPGVTLSIRSTSSRVKTNIEF